MRQALRILALGIYLVTSTGLYLHFHYCGGKLSHVGLFSGCTQSCCDSHGGGSDCCDSSGGDSGCCETMEVHFDLDDEHRVLTPLELPQLHAAVALDAPVIFTDQATHSVPDVTDGERAPPKRLFALFHSWVTYG